MYEMKTRGKNTYEKKKKNIFRDEEWMVINQRQESSEGMKEKQKQKNRKEHRIAHGYNDDDNGDSDGDLIFLPYGNLYLGDCQTRSSIYFPFQNISIY